MSAGGEFLGSAVVDGEVRFFSPSSLDKGDPRAGGCPLKWWFRYVRRIKEPETDSMAAGTKLHAELEKYQRTGDRSLSALAMSGLHMVPTGPDLIVEAPIHRVDGKVITSLLHADGVPVVGWVDHANRRGLNVGADDVTDTQDPPGTVEIIDWKWKRDGSRVEYYLTRDQLITNTQLSGYGLGVGRHYGASHVRLGHGYFPSMRGKPRKVTKLHVIQDCADNWKYVEGLARHLRGIAQESNPERIEGNRNACGSYGGCPYREQCPTYKHQSSSEIFGETASQEIRMGIQFGAPSPGQQPPAPTEPVGYANSPAVLAEEEARLRQQAAAQQVIPGFAEALARIQASGRGFPPLAGAAAQMCAAAAGQSIAPGVSYPGAGELARMPTPITEPIHVLQLANEIAPAPHPAPVAPPAPAAIPWQGSPGASAPMPWSPQAVQHVLPPDAPASNPAFAAKPVEGFAMPGAPAPAPMTFALPPQPAPAAAAPAPFMFPPAQQPQGQAAPASPSPVGATASPAAPATSPEPAKKRGRPAKNTNVVGHLESGEPIEVMRVFVDCTPNVDDCTSLHPYVDGILAELVARFCAPPALPDVRCAPKDGPLGYAGWKGAIRAIVLERPPAAGTYHLRARGDEFAEEVAAAMLTVCNKTGGLYVR